MFALLAIPTQQALEEEPTYEYTRDVSSGISVPDTLDTNAFLQGPLL
jgi:hypothetical protein